MKSLTIPSIIKILFLLLTLVFAPHSLNNCHNHLLLEVDKDFFVSLLMISAAVGICCMLIRFYRVSETSLFRKALSAIENTLITPKPALLLVLCCMCILVTASLVSIFFYDSVPRVSDEIAQLFQAKIFLSGHLTAPSPQLPEFFTYTDDNVIVAPKWYCQYPPGFPVLLTAGLWLGSPGIVNPLLAAFSVFLVYFLCRELFDKNTALIASLLFTLSPKVIFTSGSLMNHTAAMFFLLLAVTSMLFALKKQKILLSLCSGLSLGACLNIRPLDAMVLFMPIGMYCAVRCFRNRALLKIPGVWLCGFSLMAGLLLYYNYQTNGDPLTFGYVVRWGGESHQLGFHEVRGGKMHTPLAGLVNTIGQIRLNDKALFEWPVPVSFFILLLFLFARKTLWDFLLLSIILLNMSLYFFWGWSDAILMGRFYFISLPYFIILATRGIQCLGAFCLKTWQTKSMPPACGDPAPSIIIVIVLFLFAGFTKIPDFVPQYYLPILQVDRRIECAVKELKIKNAVIFIEPQDTAELIVGSGFFMNTPDLAGQDIIFAKDLGEHNKKLLQIYPGKTGYLYRHRRDIKKIFQWSNCISPPGAFELIPLTQRVDF